MISKKHKVVFIHIPKCAGTSIEKAMGHIEGKTNRKQQDHRSLRMLQPITANAFLNSGNRKELVKKFYYRMQSHSNPKNRVWLSPSEFGSFFKFSFVRNPWDRAYSWWKNVVRDPVQQKNLSEKPTVSFADFLNRHVGTGMLKPQTYWLKNFAGEIDLDFIGKFETLNRDFQKVCEKIGLQNTSLPHEIQGNRGPAYTDIYEPSMIKLVQEFYEEEIELFKYRFPGKAK